MFLIGNPGAPGLFHCSALQQLAGWFADHTTSMDEFIKRRAVVALQRTLTCDVCVALCSAIRSDARQVRPWTKLYLKSPLHPLTSYFFTYLLAGWYDGSHFNPFSKLCRFFARPPLDDSLLPARVFFFRSGVV